MLGQGFRPKVGRLGSQGLGDEGREIGLYGAFPDPERPIPGQEIAPNSFARLTPGKRQCEGARPTRRCPWQPAPADSHRHHQVQPSTRGLSRVVPEACCLPARVRHAVSNANIDRPSFGPSSTHPRPITCHARAPREATDRAAVRLRWGFSRVPEIMVWGGRVDGKSMTRAYG